MYRDNCPECGHLLTNRGEKCPFCKWRHEDQLTHVKLYQDEPEADFYIDEIRPDQLPGY